jgi:hypothetical protein
MTEENAKSTAPVHAVVSQQFEVWIICTRGTGHQWRRMATCGNRREADQLVSYHKLMDQKYPKGHYSYKVVPVSG